MGSGRLVTARISALAAATQSVVHARDLRAHGIDRDAVWSRIASGQMARMLPRTYAVGPMCHAPSRAMWCMAGLLHAGAGAVIDGEAAGELRGLWRRGGGTIDVSTEGRRVRTVVENFRFHKKGSLWLPHREVELGQLRLAGCTDMLLRMARRLTKWQLAHVIDRALYQRIVTIDELEAAAHGNGGVIGIERVRGAIELVRSGSAGTRSESEDVLLGALLEAGAPEPLVNARGALGLSRDEPDFYWPALRLNVEVDGRQHEEPGQAADDALRDGEAAVLGIRVLRIPARQLWRRRRRVVGLLMRALAGEPMSVDPATRQLRL